MAKKTKGKSKKNVRKKFHEIKVPLTASKVSLYGADAEDLEGRIVKIDLTRSLKGKGFELKFRVDNGDKGLVGKPISSQLVQSYIRKAVRRSTDYVEDSFEAECRDCIVRVKPFLVTRNRVSRAVRQALRDTAKKHLIGYLKSRNAEEIFSEMMANKLQKGMSLKLKKIYPLALCEIRLFKILRDKEEAEESPEASEKTEAAA